MNFKVESYYEDILKCERVRIIFNCARCKAYNSFNFSEINYTKQILVCAKCNQKHIFTGNLLYEKLNTDIKEKEIWGSG